MSTADERDLVFGEGVLVERSSTDGRTNWWVPAGGDAQFQYWQRIAACAFSEVADQGLLVTSVTVSRFRQRLGDASADGFRIADDSKRTESSLPNGELVEHCGDDRTDFALVRDRSGMVPLRVDRVRARWPEADVVQEVGTGLFLVSGVGPGTVNDVKDVTKLLECPRARGEQMLASAREARDRRAEATVLTDLAVMSMNEGDSQRALDRLKEALGIARELGDRKAEADVTGNFGLLSMALGDPRLAERLFEQELGLARTSGDRFAEKTALEHLGLARARSGDPRGAMQFFGQALSLARALADRQHEATLLWQQAVQHAELGERDRAVATAQSAVDRVSAMDAAQAELLAAHLQRYRDEKSDSLSAELATSRPTRDAVIGGAIVVSAGLPPPPQGPSEEGRGPGLLRKGLSAARSVTRFLATGLKVTDSDTLRKRLEACSTCEHHTGLRCKVCGCFTNVKTRMAAEACPAGKWPA